MTVGSGRPEHYTAHMTSISAPAGPGRRERKKQRTREALIDAAFRLFAAKGFEATTVEEIADAVDVSSRTFFRYFASKEDVALTFQDEQQAALFAAVRARPADEPIITAMRRAAVSVANACELGELGFDPARFACMQELMSSSPTLLAGSLEHTQKKREALVRLIADRMGVDPETDLRPHVVTAATIGVMQAGGDATRCLGLSLGSFAEAIDKALAVLEDSINFPCRVDTAPAGTH